MAALTRSKIDSLTSLRGYFAIWVVIYHFWKAFLSFFPDLAFLSPVGSSGYMAVPGFFILSGFVLVLNYEHHFKEFSLKKAYIFLLMRLSRIYPVHLATLLILLSYVVVRAGFGRPSLGESTSLSAFILNFFLVQVWVPKAVLSWNGPSWSISSEWFAYLLFPFMCVGLFSKLKSLAVCIVFGVTSLFAGIIWMIFKHEVYFFELILVIPLFFVGACVFYISKFVKMKESDNGKAQTRLQGVLSLILLLIIFAGCYLPEASKVSVLLLSMSVLIFALVITNKSTNTFWTGKIPVYLGDISYSLYMSHALAEMTLSKLLPSENVVGAAFITRSCYAGIYVLVISVVCLIVYYCVEKPCLSYFRKKIPKI